MDLPFDPEEVRRRRYDHPRDGRSYGTAFTIYLDAQPSYAANPHILLWWTPQHDALIEQQIGQWQWGWYWEIRNAILAFAPDDIIEQWRRDDPACADHAWYNVLMYFAISRAMQLGLISRIRQPKWKECPLCGHRYVEDSLSPALVYRLGIDCLDFCGPCLTAITYPRKGNQRATREDVIAFVNDLATVLLRVPPQGYGEGMHDFEGMSFDERFAALKVLQRKPTVNRVKQLFGSWLAALVESGVLGGDARRTSRGTQVIARDGHVCLSLGEKTIDDLLHRLGIAHEREPHYPEGNYRADFAVNGVLIEYLGLTGDADYDDKTKLKQRIAKKYGIRLVLMYPQDLLSTERLEAKLRAATETEA